MLVFLEYVVVDDAHGDALFHLVRGESQRPARSHVVFVTTSYAVLGGEVDLKKKKEELGAVKQVKQKQQMQQ